jgi:hypothetical protein
MVLNEYSTEDIVEELKRRKFKSIMINPYDAFSLDIIPQPGSVGDFIKGEGPVVILIIED